MDPNIPPDLPAPLTPADRPPIVSALPSPIAAAPAADTNHATSSGMRRTGLAAAVSAVLLIGGAVAVVSAASPEPSPSTSPSVTDPSVDGTTPSTRPDHAGGGTKADCPNQGTNGSDET